MDKMLYPNFRREVIDVVPESSSHWIHASPFHTKGKRKDDLFVFGLGRHGHPAEIFFYENPRNLEFDEGIQDESVLITWNRLALQELKQPSSCISLDISGNGFYDLVVTCEYGQSLDTIDPYGGRVCWLENFGTNEGDWICREIGRFPGVNCVKVGHFSTTYSLQLLAIARSSRADVYSPLIIFTRPPDVYKSQHWLVGTALEGVFSSMQDCLVIQNASGALNNLVISSREGLETVWYHKRKLCAGKVGRDPAAYIVSVEAINGAMLSVVFKDTGTQQRHFWDAEWQISVISDFTDGHGASILDVLCEDFDGDGTDEIIVSVASQGPSAGIYCFVLTGSSFVKYKLSNEPARKIAAGRFACKSKLDIAMLTCFESPKMMVLYHSFVSSQIKPSIENSELIFSIPHVASATSEIDVIDLAGFALSLVSLPPNALFNVASDGSEAIKVLHGLLGWIDSQSEVIERTRAACLPSCVIPMLVDSPEGHIRSGDEGAVFVRMRPSRLADASSLKAINIVPSYFPDDVCSLTFDWKQMRQTHDEVEDDVTTVDSGLYHLSGFRVRFDENPLGEAGTTENTELAYVHFYAARPGSATTFVKDVGSISISDNDSSQSSSVCSIRACLSNPSGDSGLVYCQDPFDWGATPPTSHQIARAQKMILPIMYEHGPFWRTISKADGLNGENVVEVEYPWHAWVTGFAGKHGSVICDVWVTFDFPPFEGTDVPRREEHNCVVC